MCHDGFYRDIRYSSAWRDERGLRVLIFDALLSDVRNSSLRNFPNSSVENKNSPRGRGKILRKNQMKLRKNEMISPKNFPTLPWKTKNIQRGIWNFFAGDLKCLLDEYPVLRTHEPCVPTSRRCVEFARLRSYPFG